MLLIGLKSKNYFTQKETGVSEEFISSNFSVRVRTFKFIVEASKKKK